MIITLITKEPIVHFSNKNVRLGVNLQKKIDEYWKELLDSGKQYTRGDVFMVSEKKEQDGVIYAIVEKTDYAHYLYGKYADTSQQINVLYTASLVESLDNKIILGIMGAQTARAGKYQLCGGGIDGDDLIGDLINVQGNIVKELAEELGIDVLDKDRVQCFMPKYIAERENNKNLAVIYKVKLKETAEEFLQHYEKFADELRKKKEIPEFEEIIILNNDKKSVENFLKEYAPRCSDSVAPVLTEEYL